MEDYEQYEQDILEKCYSNQDQILDEQDRLISSIEASPLAPNYLDSRAACRVFDDDDDEDDSRIGNFLSFRFDAGAGFLMDFSILEDGYDFPLKWRYGKFPWDDGRIEKILSAFERIKSGMKDGVIIDYNNVYRWSGFAVDLFPQTFYDRKYYYRLDGSFIRKYWPALLETPYDEYYFTGHLDFYWMKWGDIPSPFSNVEDFKAVPAAYPYAKDYFAVSYHLIRVIFPWEPTPEDLEWVIGIQSALEEMWEAVTVIGEYGDGSGTVHTERKYVTDYHFVIFPEKKIDTVKLL